MDPSRLTAVKGLHGCEASVERFVHVIEQYEGEVAWEGDVAVFSVTGHATAERAYAWSDPVSGSDRRRFYAVLHEYPVDSPEKAVRAAIVSEYRRAQDE